MKMDLGFGAGWLAACFGKQLDAGDPVQRLTRVAEGLQMAKLGGGRG